MNCRVHILNVCRPKWAACLAGCLLLGVLVLAVLRPPSVRLSFVGYQPASDGGRIALFCFSNDTPRQVTFLSDGSLRPYYQLIEYVTDAANPRIKVVTNYNFDAFFSTGSNALAAHSGVVFPVKVPNVASNATVIVNYYPPRDHLADFAAILRAFLNSSPRKLTPSYANLTIDIPSNHQD